MDNLKWWITLTPSQKVNALMAVIVIGLGYLLMHQDKYYNNLITQLTKEKNAAVVTKDSALNVARKTEIESLKREAAVKEESYQELKRRAEKNEAINEAQKQQLVVNEKYANKLIETLNRQKKINAQ